MKMYNMNILQNDESVVSFEYCLLDIKQYNLLSLSLYEACAPEKPNAFEI